MTKYWLMLGACIAMEVVATTCLKLSQGFTKPIYAAISLAMFCVIFYMLSLVFKAIPMGVAYAIWSALGIVLISLIDWLFLGQKLDTAATIGIVLMISGVLVINLFSKSTVH